MSEVTKQKILITGSNGLLGQKLVALLSQEPTVELWATSRGANRLPYQQGYQFYSADLTQKEEILTMMDMIQPCVVIHTAAMTHVDICEQNKEACWQSNVYAVDYLVQACEKYSSFLVHLSTDFVFDGTQGPYREEDLPAPVNFYGWSKLAAEKLVQRSKTPWAIIRTVLVYGIAHDLSRSNIVLWVKKSLEEHQSIKVVADQFRTPTLVEDLALGCWLVAKSRTEGILHISGHDYLSPYEMALQVADFFQLDASKIERVTSETFQEAVKRPAVTGFYIDKASELIQFCPHSFRSGINILSQQINKQE